MLLGDVGGLYGLFVSVFASILSLINFQKSDNLIASDLFKIHIEATNEKGQEEQSDTENKNQLSKPSHQSSLKQFLQSCLP